MIQGVPCEPYITPEQCQLILDTRKTKSKPTGHIYLFRGMMRCGMCGGNLGAHRSFYTVRSTGERRATVYYTCSAKDNHRNGCTNNVHIREKVVEEFLINEIDLYMLHQYDSVTPAPVVPDHTSQIRNLEAKRKRLVDAFIDGLISKDDFSNRVREIDESIKNLNSVVIPEAPTTINLPDNWKDIYNDLSLEGKRGFWFNTVSEIVVNPDKSISFSFR